MVLQLYLDDSYTAKGANRRVYVLAGHIAKAEAWAAFSGFGDSALISNASAAEFKLSGLVEISALSPTFDRRTK